MELFILVFIVGVIGAVPLQSRGVRVRRDGDPVESNSTSEFNGCILEKEEYKDGQEVPSLSPCEKCVCEAPDVVCSMIKCQPNSGCKTIQQSGQCCPEYKCDCEYNGKLYNNGERLDKPEDPCQVCYCKGGEIMCTSITCYERDDCEPHFSPDQCCPKYDHCPVDAKNVSGHSVRSVNASVYSPKREMQPWPLTNPSNSQSSTGFDDSNGSNNIYPQTIKIVEILPTTPGYVNKPSEVSVIPRVKTNDEENKEVSKEAEPHPSEEIVQGSSTTETFESSTMLVSSTSEIEHLLDTTPEPENENEKQVSEVTPERSVSTTNPLAEEIILPASSTPSEPDTEPDSQKMATIYPNYYSTESETNSTEESSTLESTTEIEGSGYELLRGGIYEEYASESPEYVSVENSTDTISNNGTSHESKEETINETQDVPSYEAYTASENYSEYSSPSANIPGGNSTFNTSVEVFDSNESSIEIKSNLKATLESESDSSSSEDSSSEEKLNESTENVNRTGSLEKNTGYFTTYSAEYFQPSENNSYPYSYEASSSENVYEEVTTISTLNAEDDGITSVEDDDVRSAANLLDSNETETTTPVDAQSIQTTLPEEFPQVEEITEKGLLKPRHMGSKFGIENNRKTPRLAYRKLDKENSYIESGSTLTFPSVLKVQSLGTDQLSSQTESSVTENTTSMARVGIYHPSKANELAGYLTIVDDKTNSTSANDSVISSHLLLTPHDLKKLAEILIHEKIKPVNLQSLNKKVDVNNNTTSDNVTDEGRSADDGLWTEAGNDDKAENFSSNPDDVNSEFKSFEVTSMESTPNKDKTNEEMHIKENISGAQTDGESGTTIATPNTSTMKENLSDDPYTSRQIRISENGNQYSSLLDDRDLIILENFFRKNIGLQ